MACDDQSDVLKQEEFIVRFPAGIIVNTATGRFHPIVFRRAPLPSHYSEPGPQRHKSIGHHTEGFATKDDAIAHIEAHSDWRNTGMEWEWDGSDVPAIVWWFNSPAT